MTTKANVKTFLDGAMGVNSARVQTTTAKEEKIQKAIAFFLITDPSEGVFDAENPPTVFINEGTGLVDYATITPDLMAEAVSRWIDHTYAAAIQWEAKKAADATQNATPDTIDT